MEQPMDLTRLIQLAQSQPGRQLLALLQQTGGQSLQSALEQARSGNYSTAKETLSSLLDTPEAKKILQELGGNP